MRVYSSFWLGICQRAVTTRKASLALGLAAGLSAALASASAFARPVTDMGGTVVQVPDAPSAIADLWFAHNESLVMLGAASKIKVTAENPKDRPWLFKIAPALLQAKTGVRPNTADPEDLLNRKIDLVFVSDQGQAETLRHKGLTVLNAHYVTWPDMLRSLDMTAQALGTPYARDTAALYRKSMENTLQFIQERLAPLDAAQRPRVLHIAKLKPLQVDGTDTLIDSWITTAGGRNAATVTGNHRPTTFEQIAAWNPDFIILDPSSGAPDATSPLRTLKAFQDGKWAVSPQGVFAWDRYGFEELLQIQWAAKQLHPSLFQDVNMTQKVQDFYKTFFHYTLSADDAARILAAQPPA
ncbi:MAG: ABC transporter substrate-binding protein [Acetobacter cibinongensis]